MLSNQCNAMFAGAPNSFFCKEISGSRETFKALRASDLRSDGYIATEELQDIEIKEGKEIGKFILQAGDVVLLARGQSMRCCIVDEAVAKLKLVVTANFIVLRLSAEQSGEFLVTYFNSPIGKQALNSPSISSSTNAVKSISLGGLKKLELPFPSIAKQRQIASLFHAHVKAKRAAMSLIDEQEKAVEAKVLNWIWEEGQYA
ncbi:restriction endonuclease subunit S [Vibrio vulnificus]|uniref:restriction endonuclease subunit S n=1 Tax=Vibrio vulnificus TaxID=672 RepID=UPI001CDCCBDD|nr:restriction endonuclease subunit S [Vibrio vulnificus]MCA3902078.1 restriction endonuclease subunit S [Vibrio vulnificus]